MRAVARLFGGVLSDQQRDGRSRRSRFFVVAALPPFDAERATCALHLLDSAMVRSSDGHGRPELAKYRSPAVISAGPGDRLHNIVGTHRVMFAVDDIEVSRAA